MSDPGNRRAVLALGAAIVVLTVALGVVVAGRLGGGSGAASGAGSQAAAARRMAGGPKVSPDATAPPPDPASPLASDIPGCVCHSDDPDLVSSHAAYRMNQCFGCHEGPLPGMGG